MDIQPSPLSWLNRQAFRLRSRLIVWLANGAAVIVNVKQVDATLYLLGNGNAVGNGHGAGTWSEARWCDLPITSGWSAHKSSAVSEADDVPCRPLMRVTAERTGGNFLDRQ